MKIKYTVIHFCLLLAVCGCSTKQNEMSLLVNASLERAAIQSKKMAESLLNEENKLPRTIGKKESL